MIKKLFLVLVLISTIYATVTEDLKVKFIERTNNIVNIVKQKDLQKDIRNNKIVEAVTPMFDFKLMAKLSLGKYWKTMILKKQEEFIGLYVKRMKQSYSSKIDKYTDEKIIVNSVKQVKKTRIVLNSSLVSVDDKLEVIYKFYKPKKQFGNKNRWLVYDVIIAGVSIIKTDKAQFKAVLKESSIDELMVKLK